MTKHTSKNPVLLCVSSGKGGVGKTTFSVNLAAALALHSKRVLLIDGDLGLANVDVLLGLNVRHTIRETIEQGIDPAKLLVEIIPGFKVLPASSGIPEMANLSHEEQEFLTGSLARLTGAFDYVIIDTAAGIGDSVLWFNNWARKNIVILSPDPTSMTDAYALMKVLNGRHGKNEFYLVINSVKNKKQGADIFAGISKVLDSFLHISPISLGFLPQDSKVVAAIRTRKPFTLSEPDCRATRALNEIAGRVLQLEV